MLCAIQELTNDKVLAIDSEKDQGPYLCPKCRLELVLRKGRIKVHHFAHKPPITCSYGRGESDAHRKAKLRIYEALKKHPDVAECDLEKNLGDVISDVYAVIKGIPTALEVQISALSMDEIIYRTETYYKKGIAVLWLPLFSEKLNGNKYSPRAWEKWLHATYFGRVYYWLTDLTVMPVHFGVYKLQIGEKYWHDQFGEEQWRSSYEQPSRKWKAPLVGAQANIVRDFIVQERHSWQGGKMSVPTCHLLTDLQQSWWK